MLICNNCSTSNADDAVRCVHCNMRGNFTRQYGEPHSDRQEPEAIGIICRNCGSDSPGEGHKCRHCRFPLQAQRPKTGKQVSPDADPLSSVQLKQR